MLRRFAKWLEYGYLTPEGVAFDIGATTKQALLNYLNGVPLECCAPRNEWNCGNGSLMRILPVEFYLQAQPAAGRYEIIRNVSALTHAHICCTLGCFLYCAVAGEIIQHRERFKLATLLVRGVIRAVDDLRQVLMQMITVSCIITAVLLTAVCMNCRQMKSRAAVML